MTATYTEELATEISVPNIDIYKTFEDGEHFGYKAQARDGFVMYDTTEENFEMADIDSDPVPVTYYYVGALLPLQTDFENFAWLAVPRDSVDERYIF